MQILIQINSQFKQKSNRIKIRQKGIYFFDKTGIKTPLNIKN